MAFDRMMDHWKYYSEEEIIFCKGQYCETSSKDFPNAYIGTTADHIYVSITKNNWSTLILVTDIIRIPFLDKMRHKKLFKLVSGL